MELIFCQFTGNGDKISALKGLSDREKSKMIEAKALAKDFMLKY